MSGSYLQKVVQERGGEIRFIRAEENGMPCWFYLKLTPEKLREYETALQDGAMDVRDYGRILESDWGSYPPEDVVRFMKDEYGFLTPRAE